MKESAAASEDSANDIILRISDELTIAIEQSKQAEKIKELTNEILSISAQTNLLALNEMCIRDSLSGIQFKMGSSND